jgi:hypothetical protein
LHLKTTIAKSILTTWKSSVFGDVDQAIKFLEATDIDKLRARFTAKRIQELSDQMRPLINAAAEASEKQPPSTQVLTCHTMAMDLQQPLSWFAGKPLPGNGQTQHGDRRHHTRYETEPIQNGRVVLASNSPTNGGITNGSTEMDYRFRRCGHRAMWGQTNGSVSIRFLAF